MGEDLIEQESYTRRRLLIANEERGCKVRSDPGKKKRVKSVLFHEKNRVVREKK